MRSSPSKVYWPTHPLIAIWQLRIVFPYSSAGFSRSKDWVTINSSHGCYVRLPENTTVAFANQQLKILSKKYRTPDNKNVQVLQSLAEVHFDAKAGNFSGKTITPDRIRTLWMIAAFILVIACVNFLHQPFDRTGGEQGQGDRRTKSIGWQQAAAHETIPVGNLVIGAFRGGACRFSDWPADTAYC